MLGSQGRKVCLILGCVVLWSACRSKPTSVVLTSTTIALTHGPLAAEVDEHSARVWGRCSGAGPLYVRLLPSGVPQAVVVTAAHDFAGAVALDGLTADTPHDYEVWCGEYTATKRTSRGQFRTPPPANVAAPVRLAWGGDVSGQNVCRDAVLGYPIFPVLSQLRPDAFIALGDMIYADDPCRAVGRYGNAQVVGPPAAAGDTSSFWTHWRYNRDDNGLRAFLASTASYGVWDDHEVRNDFGPHDDADAAGQSLFAPGRQAFLDYNPMPTPERMYRSVRWGRHIELFVLDTRSYRDRNATPDSAEHPKTLLGAEQLEWLKRSVAGSDATWKVIVSSVPLVIPTSTKERGRDGWSGFDTPTGFGYELRAILESFRRNGVRNQLWISTDVHFAAVFRHVPFADTPGFAFHEIDTGPLNAGVFPKAEFDTWLNSQRLFLHPQPGAPTPSFDAALGWFNFGTLSVNAAGQMMVDIRDARGERLYELNLAPN